MPKGEQLVKNLALCAGIIRAANREPVSLNCELFMEHMSEEGMNII